MSRDRLFPREQWAKAIELNLAFVGELVSKIFLAQYLPLGHVDMRHVHD